MEISILFWDRSNDYYKDGSPTLVYPAKEKIFYRASGEKGFYSLKEESYEEALSLVKKSGLSEKSFFFADYLVWKPDFQRAMFAEIDLMGNKIGFYQAPRD